MSNNAPVTNDVIPDLREIAMTVWRNRLLIALVMGVSFLTGAFFVMLKPRTYQAMATVMLDQSGPNLADFSDVTGNTKFDDKTLQTEVSVLKSPALALQTIKTAGLDQNPKFGKGDATRALSGFQSGLNIASQPASRIITIGFEAGDADTAAKIANAHAQTYLNSQVAFKQKRVAELSKWFEAKVTDLKADVVKKSQAVMAYRQKNGLLEGKDSQELVSQQISDISAQLAPIEARKFEVQGKLDALEEARQSKRPYAIADVVNSGVIQNLKTQASTAAQQVESYRSQYGENHPKLAAAQGQLAQVNKAIGSEIANIRTSLKNQLAAAEAQEKLLHERLDSLNTEANGSREELAELNNLEVERDAAQKLLDNFLANYQTVQSQASFARPDAVIVSEAVPPAYPKGPGKKILMLGVLFFSACLSLAVVFGLETMRGGVRNFRDVRRFQQKPLGIMPTVDQPAKAMLGTANSSFKESVKRIYMASLMNSPARTLLVTSALPNEGRTTFVIAMAHYLSSLGHKVVVVDADTLRPALSRQLKTANGPGLADVLAGRASLAEAMARDANGLAILRAGTAAQSPDAFRAERLRAVIDQLKETFNYILIDSGPLLAHTEARVIAGEVDGIVAITEWIKTSQQDVGNMFATLREFPAPVLGVVINKVDIGKYKVITSGSDFLLPNVANAA